MTPSSEDLLYRGREYDYPAVRLKPGMVLMAGEKNWQKYLVHSTEYQRDLLSDALWCGKAQGPGCVGIVGDGGVDVLDKRR